MGPLPRTLFSLCPETSKSHRQALLPRTISQTGSTASRRPVGQLAGR